MPDLDLELTPGVNHQTGTSYTIQHSDREKLVTFSNANPVAVTVPRAIGAFGIGFRFKVQNLGVGTVTLTPATSTVNGSATQALTTNQAAEWNSDGTDWDAPMVAKGDTGATGAAGAAGAAGATGATGPGILAMEQQSGSSGPAPLINNSEIQLANPFSNLASGILNVVKRKLIVTGVGRFSSGVAQTPTLTIYLEVAGTNVVGVTTEALTASLSNKMFRFRFEFVTLSIGAGATGLVRGEVYIDLAGTGVYSHYETITFGGSPAVDLTGVWKPKLNIKAVGTNLDSADLQESSYQILPASI